MNNREKIDKMKKELENTKGYNNLYDKVITAINDAASQLAEDTGYNEGMIYIALHEMLGISDTYSLDEIETQLEDFN